MRSGWSGTQTAAARTSHDGDSRYCSFTSLDDNRSATDSSTVFSRALTASHRLWIPTSVHDLLARALAAGDATATDLSVP